MSTTILGVTLSTPLSDPGIGPNGDFTMGGTLTPTGGGPWADTGVMHFQWDQGSSNWTDLTSSGALNIAEQTNPITGIQDTNEHTFTVYNDGTTGTFSIRIYVIDEDTDEFYSDPLEILVDAGEEVNLDGIKGSILALDGTDHPALTQNHLLSVTDSVLALDGTDHPSVTPIKNLSVKNSNLGLNGTDHPTQNTNASIAAINSIHTQESEIVDINEPVRWVDDSGFEFTDDGTYDFVEHEVWMDIKDSILGIVSDLPELSVAVIKTLTVANSEHSLFTSNQTINVNANIDTVNSELSIEGNDHPSLSSNQQFDVVNSRQALFSTNQSLSCALSIDAANSSLTIYGTHPSNIVDRKLNIQSARHGILSGAQITGGADQVLSVQNSSLSLFSATQILNSSFSIPVLNSKCSLIGSDHPLLTVLQQLNTVSLHHDFHGTHPALETSGEQVLAVVNSAHALENQDILPTIAAYSIPTNSFFALTVSTVNISKTNNISVLDSALAQSGEHPTLSISGVKTLSVVSSSLALSNDSIGLTGGLQLSADTATHEHESETPDFTPEEVRWVDSEEAEFIDTPVDFVPHEIWLNPVDAIHKHECQHPILLYLGEQLLSPQISKLSHTGEEPTLTFTASINSTDSILGHNTQIATATKIRNLTVCSSNLALSGADHPDIDVDRQLSILDSAHDLVGIDHPSLILNGQLGSVSTSHAIESSYLSLARNQALFATDASHVVTVSTPTVSINANISVTSTVHSFAGTHPDIEAGAYQTVSAHSAKHKLFSSNQSLSISIQLDIDNSVFELAGTHPELSTGQEETLTIQSCQIGHESISVNCPISITANIYNSILAISSELPLLTSGGEQVLSIQNTKHNQTAQIFDINLSTSVTGTSATHENITGRILKYRNTEATCINAQHSQKAEVIDFVKIRNLRSQDSTHSIESQISSNSINSRLVPTVTKHKLSRSSVEASTAQWLSVVGSNHELISNPFNLVEGLIYAATFVSRDSPYNYSSSDNEYIFVARRAA